MVDLTPEDFDELVARALDTLPAELAALMSNVAVFVEEQKPGMQLERQSGAGAAEAQRYTAARRSS